jgi:radical SAM superfamily enzyme YgiQ (UPF0313 family)
MENIDLLLINPASRPRVYQSLGSKLAAIENPVWAGLMATYCRQAGLSVMIIDAEAEELSAEQVAQRVAECNPVLAAVVVYGHQPSASTQIMTASSQVCTAIKNHLPQQKVMFVGGHVTALPERTMREENADFVAGGEGLVTLVQLVQCLKEKGNVADVPGLWHRDGRWTRYTRHVPLTENLDQAMPAIAWDLLPMSRYRAHNWHCLGGLDRQPYAAIYTTLGCPYHCSFCCIQAPFKSGEIASGRSATANSYRFWSVKSVLDQIDTLVTRYGVRNLKIADEMFVLNKKHVLGICDGIIERGYDLNIWAYTRVDTIKDGMLPKLKAAGFNWLALGIEAGSDRVRAEVDKAFDQDQVYRVVESIRAAGINTIGNYIFGLPEDDLDTMQATLNLANDLNCEFSNFYSAMAYPGSPLYAMAQRQGVPLPKEWTGYSQHSRDCLPMPTKHIPAREVLRFRDQAFVQHYTSARYLEQVRQKFGSETVREIHDMTRYQLQRDLLTGALEVDDQLLPADEPAQPLQQLSLAR